MACTASNPRVCYRVEVPKLAKLPGQDNPKLAGFALKLATKALTNTEGYDGYAANLIAFAQHVSRGLIPSEMWQLRNLGHLVKVA